MRIHFESLKINEIEKYKELRFRALKEEIYSFGHTLEEEKLLADDYIFSLLNGRANAIIVAKDSEKFVGMLYVKYFDNEKFRHSAEISGVYVAPEYRGMKLAKDLFSFTFKYLKTFPDIEKVRLSMIDGQVAAYNLYKKLGFDEIGRHKKELLINGEYFDEILFEKFIK